MFENFVFKCFEFDKVNEGFSYFLRFLLFGYLNKMYVF